MAIREQTKILAFPDRDTKLRLVADAMLEQYRLNGNKVGTLPANLSIATVSKISVDDDGESFDIGRHLRINDEWVKITDVAYQYRFTFTSNVGSGGFPQGTFLNFILNGLATRVGQTAAAAPQSATTFLVTVPADKVAFLEEHGREGATFRANVGGRVDIVLTEDVVPGASVTFARGANGSTAASHSNGDSIYDDNGPYTYVDMWSDEGLVYVHLKDANPV